jgi:hypothetical protein
VVAWLCLFEEEDVGMGLNECLLPVYGNWMAFGNMAVLSGRLVIAGLGWTVW